MIILDFGSGMTCRNDRQTINKMIEELAKVDPDRKCVVKFQLWSKGTEPQCLQLEWDKFAWAFDVGSKYGFRVTASVFDKPSLDFLLGYDVPFIKLANRPYLRHLARYVPRGIPIVYSVESDGDYCELADSGIGETDEVMLCVSQYPAPNDEYEEVRGGLDLKEGVSDHTIGLDLWRKYHPTVWEKHFKLPDQRGPDCGPWCITPSELVEVLK